MKTFLRYLQCLILVVFIFDKAYLQTPHGEDFMLDCALCHNADNWHFRAEESSFSHDNTDFPLQGRHINLNCRSCHVTLEFKKAESTCLSCHSDVHQQTVGNDCARCHHSDSWIVEDVTRLHELVSFPLMGAHATVNCDECHLSETNLRFDPVNPDCISCHQSDYKNAKNPDHVAQAFPTDCSLCHRLTGNDWTGGGIVHSFFPLEQGHNIKDCTICHKSPVYSDLSPDCINCHQTDYDNAKTPDHRSFPTNCNICHSLAIGWMPANFPDHDNYFPIYSGNHKGEWSKCSDCHTDENNYSVFSCTDCHEHNNESELAKDHRGVSGYAFVSTACYGCHPRGDE